MVHENPYRMFTKYAVQHIKSGDKVLEIGPDNKFYLKSILPKDIEYEIGELEGKEGNVHFNEYDCSDGIVDNYDVIVATNVIEHVRRPWVWVSDLARQLKEDGFLILTSPITWGHHKSPYDCWRVYPDGFRSLFKEAGLKEILCQLDSFDGETDCIGVAQKHGI